MKRIKNYVLTLLTLVIIMLVNLNNADASNNISGYLKIDTNVRDNLNGNLLYTLDKGTHIIGETNGNWIKIGSNEYIYNFGLDLGEYVSGHLKTDTNVRDFINGNIVDKYIATTIVSGNIDGNWIRLDNGNYIYNFSFAEPTSIDGILTVNTNIRDSKNGNLVDTYEKGTYVKGVMDGNWIKLENGNYLYNFGLIEGAPISGYLTEDMNVRTEPSGSIIAEVYKKHTYIEGIVVDGWIKLDNGLYIYNYGVLDGELVSGYLPNNTNVRTAPKDGTIVDTYPIYTFVSGIEVDGWIRMDNNHYIYNFGLLSGIPVSGHLGLNTNVRTEPSTSATIVEVYPKTTLVSGTKDGNWIKLDNGYYIYDLGFIPEEIRSGYLTLNVNVRDSKNGNIIDLYSIDTYVSGVKDGNWIKLDSGDYIYDFELKFGLDVSGYLTKTVNIRVDTNYGEIVGEYKPGQYIIGQKHEDWIKLDENSYIFDFGLYTMYEIKEEYPALYEKMNGNQSFIITLDPGHGGGEAYNRGGLLFNEGDENYNFSQLLEAEASKYKDVLIINTRISNEEDPSFDQRKNYGNSADLFISLHSNASAETVRGTETWGSNENDDLEFAKDLSTTISDTLDTNDRGVKYSNLNKAGSFTREPVEGVKDYYGVLRDNEAEEKIIVESFFHTNLTDSQNYLDNRELLAQKFMEVIARHYNLTLK